MVRARAVVTLLLVVLAVGARSMDWDGGAGEDADPMGLEGGRAPPAASARERPLDGNGDDTDPDSSPVLPPDHGLPEVDVTRGRAGGARLSGLCKKACVCMKDRAVCSDGAAGTRHCTCDVIHAPQLGGRLAEATGLGPPRDLMSEPLPDYRVRLGHARVPLDTRPVDAGGENDNGPPSLRGFDGIAG